MNGWMSGWTSDKLLVAPFIFERRLRRNSGDRTIFTPTRLETVSPTWRELRLCRFIPTACHLCQSPCVLVVGSRGAHLPNLLVGTSYPHSVPDTKPFIPPTRLGTDWQDSLGRIQTVGVLYANPHACWARGYFPLGRLSGKANLCRNCTGTIMSRRNKCTRKTGTPDKCLPQDHSYFYLASSLHAHCLLLVHKCTTYCRFLFLVICLNVQNIRPSRLAR